MSTKEIFKDMSTDELRKLFDLKKRRRGSSADIIMQEILRRDLFNPSQTCKEIK